MKMHAWGLYRFVTALSMTFCYVSSIQFSACQDARKNNFCNMTCETVDFQQAIDFKCNGTSRGSCTPFLGCTANLYQESPDKTIFTIPSLSYSNDIGNWTCSYGTTDAPSQYFIVYGNASTPNITKYDPPVNSVDVESVELTAVLECAYPATPSIILEFDEEGKGIYKTFKSVQPSVSAPTLGQCSDNLESIVTAEVKASYDENDQAFAGKRGYLRVKFFYNTIVEFTTSRIGPFTFKLACTGSFHCGFWLLLLAVVTSIIILILMWKKVKRFGFSASGFSNMKIGITAVFSVVAIGTGIGLGLGLREGQANCLECGATIGISIALGVALSVIQFIVIINCDKEKGCDGNSEGETSDRSNGDRARTPASATGVNLEQKKKSQNKPTEKGTEASSLTSKTFGHPLPDTPNTRKNQLEPLKTDSLEMENSTTEKKKKKKKKKKRETSEGNEASEEKEERPELEF